MLAKISFSLLAFLVLLAGGAVLKNKVPLLEPPGPVKRLRVYLSTHRVETRVDHEFPELRTRTYALPPAEMFERVRKAVDLLGWETAAADERAYTIHAVVATPWLGFKDDVRIRLEQSPDEATAVHISSQSRVGSADFGANVAHVLALDGALGPGY